VRLRPGRGLDDDTRMRPRRLCVVTTSRADYGLLYWILRDLRGNPRVRLQLVVTGMHFSARHGRTYQDIRADGFKPAAEVRETVRSDSDRAVAEAIGRITIGTSRALARLRPDLIVILGDRYELLAVAAAATAFRIPVAHLHGGEATEGLIDEPVRNAITKLSHLHLVAAKPYGKRVVSMGEEPWRVRVVGSPGLDHLRRSTLPNGEDVLAEIGAGPAGLRPLFMVTLHPETLSRATSRRHARELVRALATFRARIVVTATNADQEHVSIFRELKKLDRSTNAVKFVSNLGSARYLAILREADVLVGNSSSGLTEAPSFGTPVVNIGDRQKGRLRAANVIDVPASAPQIRSAIRRALTPAFRRRARRARNPYGEPGASSRIAKILSTVRIDERLLRKSSTT
jgi:UDP-hydrolysing UDP-N-acetyl-D-glucosamine 2-epimerase